MSVTGKPVASNTFVFIDPEPHPGLNIYYFLLVQRCHFVCQKFFKIHQQSTGSADRYACRTPHFHMHSDCTACVVQTHHATRVAQHIWIVCHKKFVIRAPCLIPCCTLHRTEHLHFLTYFSNPRQAFCKPLRSTAAPPGWHFHGTTTSHSCMVESPESTRQRAGIFAVQKHEDRIEGKGFTSMTHHKLGV